MTALDATGLYALEAFADRLRETGRTLLLCGARDQPAKLLARADFVQQVGHNNILPDVQAALARARVISGAVITTPLDIATDLAPEIAHDMEIMKI
jgi:SulP family sulfate permease